jgi:cobalt-precorrin 5A hydrolase
MRNIAVYGLTRTGARLASRVAETLGGDLHLPEGLAEDFSARPFSTIAAAVRENFEAYSAHVFVAAAGIVVRSIAPLLRGKDRDPGVVVLDQAGEFAVSLLSGHLGGANRLARRIAELFNAVPVVTTATDTADILAVDVLAMETDMAIANLRAARAVNAALLESKPIQVYDPEDRLGLHTASRQGYAPEFVDRPGAMAQDRPGILVTWRREEPVDEENHLLLHPRCLAVGIGCHQGTPAATILELVVSVFDEHGLSLSSIRTLASVSSRSGEPGLLRAAHLLEAPLTFLDKERLAGAKVPNPSEHVKKYLGVESVCEAAALIAAEGGRLLADKARSEGATVAVALQG